MGTSCFDGACLATAVRSIAPLSGLVLNSRRPLFRWSHASGVEGVQIEICADRPCATVEHAETVAADSLRLADALAPGVHFWRLHAVRAHRQAHRITPGLIAALANANGEIRVVAAQLILALGAPHR